MSSKSLSTTETEYLAERPPSLAWASIRQEFAPSRTRIRSAVRLALACTVALIFSFIFNWSPASNAMIPPLLLNRPDVRYDLRQALWAIASVTVMAAFYYWSLNFSQRPLWFGLVLGSGLVLHGALTTLPTIGQSLSIGQVIPSSLLANYFYLPNVRQSLFLPLLVELVLGFGVALTIDYLVWPYSPRKEWDERFRRAWGKCRRAAAAWFAGETPAGGLMQRPDPLDRQLEEVLGLLNNSIKPVDEADPGPAIRRAAARKLEEIIILLQDLGRLGRGAHAEEQQTALTRLGQDIDARFASLGCLLAGRADGASGPEPGADEEEKNAFPVGARGPEAVRREDLRQLRDVLGGCREIFHALTRLPAAESLTRREQSLTWTPPFRFGDLRKLDAQSWQHGVKVAIVVLAGLGIWQALRLPSGATVLFLALLVMLPDLGRSSRQTIDCALGVLLGLLLAFLSVALVVKYVETIYGYGLCVFGVLFVLGYLAGASPRLGYIGLQGAISYVVVFVSSDRQSVNLEPLRERFVALVFGVGLALIVLHNLWPVRKVKDLFKILAGNLAACAQVWAHLPQPERAEWPKQQETFVRDFNRGWVQAAVLTNNIEFEGGEGSPRYGYASRLLTHEIALFGQLNLFNAAWTNWAASIGGVLPASAEHIGRQLADLCERLGQDVELPSAAEAGNGESRPAPTGDELQDSRWSVLEERAGEIEQILASLDRLTSMRVPS